MEDEGRLIDKPILFSVVDHSVFNTNNDPDGTYFEVHSNALINNGVIGAYKDIKYQGDKIGETLNVESGALLNSVGTTFAVMDLNTTGGTGAMEDKMLSEIVGVGADIKADNETTINLKDKKEETPSLFSDVIRYE